MKAWLAALVAAAPLCAADGVEPARTPVLVELFTSEGCSSCPPADTLLNKLEQQQPAAGATVIVLEEHVDYWDREGWRDPFSSAEFTARQQRYAQWLHVDSPYTPQMIIDGHSELVGSDWQKAVREVAKAASLPKIPVRLALRDHSADRVSLAVAIDAGASGDVLLAIAESGLATDVTGGENAGRKWQHSAVVRKLIPIGKCKARKMFSMETVVKLPHEWKRENLSAVAFVQEREGGRVLGAGELAFGERLSPSGFRRAAFGFRLSAFGFQRSASDFEY